MKLIECPINGLRPAQEFAFGGAVRSTPDPATADDAAWAAHVYHRPGEPGVKREWWYHIPSGTWFVAERDNVTDRFVRTYLYDADARSDG